ncbi:uncharacterized protein L199_005952 [Kwoniella botswanensis]|uniref:uncharacterized protein n=1 Tax=Kwoniella botswanensis TaxID=1268659 RepID=UPI00315DE3EB
MPSFIHLTFLFFATLNYVMGGYIHMVIDSERDQASALDKFVEEHQDTYDFIARSVDGRIIIQIRHEDDTVEIEGYFTETQALLNDLDIAQQSILAASLAVHEGAGGTTLQSLKDYRYGDPQSEAENEKRQLSCWMGIDDKRKRDGYLISDLEERRSSCGQFCSTRFDCWVIGCQRCYHTGGACRWQKSCQRSPFSDVADIISHDIL